MNRLHCLLATIALALLPVGCSIDAPTPRAKAFIVGDSVVIEANIEGDYASSPRPASFTLQGVTHESASGSTTFVFPLKDVPAGVVTWNVEAARGGQAGTAPVNFEVPSSRDANAWQLIGCRMYSGMEDQVSFTGDGVRERVEFCGVSESGDVDLILAGTSTLFHEHRKLNVEEASNNEPHRLQLNVARALAHVPIAQLVDDVSDSSATNKPRTTVELQFAATEGGPTTTVTMSTRTGFHRLLSDILEKHHRIPGAKTNPTDADAPMLVRGLTPGKPRALSSPGQTIGDLAHFAVVTQGEEMKLPGQCGPYSDRNDGGVLLDHFAKERTVVVYRVDTGAEVARKVFMSKDCPGAVEKGGSAVSIVPDETISAWLQSVPPPK